jgi:ATP/maltotriose-dependent transcriptional regulator MalT
MLMVGNGQINMTNNSHFIELISLAKMNYPDANFGFLANSVYSESLTKEEQRAFIQLIEFARTLHFKNPIYEPVYNQLVYLYVLNGSRLDALSRLDRRIRGLVDGQASLALISGNSGIGKTSLVMALQQRIDQLGADFIIVRCSEQEGIPYELWHDIAFSLASADGTALDELPAPIGNGRAAKSIKHLSRALLAWLGKTTATNPLVVLLDDLHWTDTDSLNILNDLTSHDQKPKILFIGTYRSEERNLGHPFYNYWPKFQRNRLFEHLHLEPLTEDDIQRLATSFHGPSSTQLGTYLFERAGGHPLFTMELLNNLIDQYLLLENDDGYWLPPEASVPVPSVLRQLISQRIRRLGLDIEKLLSVAAVAGETWPLQIVEPLLDLPEEGLLAALELALAADLIVVEDDKAETYRFSHRLIKQVLYGNQLARRRKKLHKKIAVQFEKQQASNIYLIAHHYYEAEAWGKAFHYCGTAGDQAANSFANNRALELHQKTLDAAQRAADDIEPRDLLDAYERLGGAFRVLDRQQEAEIIYSRMRDAAQSMNDREAEVRALAHLTHIRISLYQMDIAEQTGYEALKIGEQIDDPRLLVRIHDSLAKLLLVRGQMDELTLHINEIRHHASDLNDPAPLSGAFRQQAFKAIWIGKYAEAEALAQQSLELGLMAGLPLHIGGGYQILSYSQIESGKYREAFEHIHSILDFNEIADPYHHQLPRLLNQLGFLYLELGDAAQALVWDRRATEASLNSPGTSNFEMQRYSLLNLATDHLYLGNLDEALEAVAQFEAVKEAPFFTHFRYYNRYLLLLAELQLAQNDFTKAVDLAREAREFAQPYKTVKNIAKSHWFEGRALLGMGKTNEALAHLQEALRIADEIQHGSLRWKIRLSLAQAMLDSGRSTGAIVQQARAMMNQTVDNLAGSHLQESFLSSPWFVQIEALEKSPVPQKSDIPAGLTPREIEVLRLVAGGATNQQVADALFISVRTVNTHMTNILNKTGCDNRTAASAFAAQHNLLST